MTSPISPSTPSGTSGSSGVDPTPQVVSSPSTTVDTASPVTQAQIASAEAAISSNYPVLAPPLKDNMLTISKATDANIVESEKLYETSAEIAAADVAAGAGDIVGVLSQIANFIQEVNSWVSDAKAEQANVLSAFNSLQSAINAFNSNIPDGGQVNNINTAITTFNTLQSDTPAAYLAYMQSQGGGDESKGIINVTNSINAAFNTWNTYLGSHPGVATVASDVQTAISNYTNTINSANAVLDEINTERAASNLTPVSTFPDPSTAYTLSNPVSDYPPLSSITATQGQSPIPLMLDPTGLSATLLATQKSLTLAVLPTPADADTSPVYQNLATQLSIATTKEGDLLNTQKEQFNNIFDPSEINRPGLPSAFKYKVDPNFIAAGGTGKAGSGVIGAGSTLNRIVPSGLIKTILNLGQVAASDGLIAALQHASVITLNASSIAASVPAALNFGSSLSSISQKSPTFAAVITSAVADNLQSASASNASVQLSNILLKNLTGAASAAGIQGVPSAGQIAQISGSLGAAVNLNLLGVSLAAYQQALGIPTLSLQVLANTDGLSAADAVAVSRGNSSYVDSVNDPGSVDFAKQSLTNTLATQGGITNETAALAVNNAIDNSFNAGSQLQSALQNQLTQQGLSSDAAALLASQGIQLLNSQSGVPGLNQAIPSQVQAGSAASEALEAIIQANVQQGELAANSQAAEDIVKHIVQDRENTAAILKESIIAEITSGKDQINLKLRNSAVAALSAGGYQANESQYIANQLINQINGNPVTPLSSTPPIKVMDKDELTKSLSAQLDTVLTGLGAAHAGAVRDHILKSVLDVKNPNSIVNQIKEQIVTLKNNADDLQKTQIHDNLIALLRTLTRPNAELGNAISSMQNHAAIPLNVAAAAHAVPQNLLTGSPG